jgi:hypothetical protein
MWENWFDNFICKIYQKLGGDCPELPAKADDKARAVEVAYREGGPPEFPDPESKAEFLGWLTELEGGLDDPASTLSPECTELLEDMIADLRAELDP